jgi:hypothetical protein
LEETFKNFLFGVFGKHCSSPGKSRRLGWKRLTSLLESTNIFAENFELIFINFAFQIFEEPFLAWTFTIWFGEDFRLKSSRHFWEDLKQETQTQM